MIKQVYSLICLLLIIVSIVLTTGCGSTVNDQISNVSSTTTFTATTSTTTITTSITTSTTSTASQTTTTTTSASSTTSTSSTSTSSTTITTTTISTTTTAITSTTTTTNTTTTTISELLRPIFISQEFIYFNPSTWYINLKFDLPKDVNASMYTLERHDITSGEIKNIFTNVSADALNTHNSTYHYNYNDKHVVPTGNIFLTHEYEYTIYFIGNGDIGWSSIIFPSIILIP